MTGLRGYFAAKTAIVGAPTTTPSAYIEMRMPALPIASSWLVAHSGGSRSWATSGRRPIMTNSVMPTPNEPMARERSATVAAPLESVEE